MGCNKKTTPSRLKTAKKLRIEIAKRNYDFKNRPAPEVIEAPVDTEHSK